MSRVPLRMDKIIHNLKTTWSEFLSHRLHVIGYEITPRHFYITISVDYFHPLRSWKVIEQQRRFKLRVVTDKRWDCFWKYKKKKLILQYLFSHIGFWLTSGHERHNWREIAFRYFHFIGSSYSVNTFMIVKWWITYVPFVLIRRLKFFT